MIKVALVRGKYLNNYEGQNYQLRNVRLTGISSLCPLDTNVPFPTKKLFSLADLSLPFLKQGANRLLGDVHILFGLEKLSKSFDIFHTADAHYYYSYQLATLRSQNKIKHLIATSWETIPFNNESVARKKYIKRFTHTWIDLFICYTDKAKRALIKEGIAENKIEVIRLGVDIDKFRTSLSAKASRDKQNSIVILFVGRLVAEKGMSDLREAFDLVKAQNSNVALRILSQGINYQNMPNIYRQADIFVLPSKRTRTWEEQYGMVLVEAMASGLPIVAYDTGAISEILGGVGILVEEGNTLQLSQQILKLVNDENLRIKLGRMGRKRAEAEFDREKTAKRIEAIYKKIMQK